MMDRMEILKLAIGASKDAKEALALARDMVAFVQEEKAPPAPLQAKAVIQSAPTEIMPIRSKNIVDMSRKRWTSEDCHKAATLLDNGASYTQVGEILGRSRKSIQIAMARGQIPAKNHKLNEALQVAAAKGALAKGLKLSDKMLDLLTSPNNQAG
jgi:hypothetical protein